MDRLLGRLEGHQRQPAVAVDARDQGKLGPGLLEHQGGALHRACPGEGLCDIVFHGDRPIDLDEFARVLQGRQEGTHILVGHGQSVLAVREYKA